MLFVLTIQVVAMFLILIPEVRDAQPNVLVSSLDDVDLLVEHELIELVFDSPNVFHSLLYSWPPMKSVEWLFQIYVLPVIVSLG